MGAIAFLVGVPLWLVLGWEAAALWRQYQIRQMIGAFKTKIRIVSGTHKHVGSSFPFRPEHALWEHDVLFMEKGFLLRRLLHFAVTESVQPPQPADPKQVRWLGDAPVTLQFRLDDGTVIEIAVPGEMSAKAQGPFFSSTSQ
jgi:hypothetical protein